MANEITVQSTMRINKVTGGLTPLTFQSPSSSVDQANMRKVSGVVDCTTTAASIDLTDLTTKGFCYFENTGDTNNVIVTADDGSGESDAFIFPPGVGYHVFLVTGSTYKAKTAASTSSLVFEAYGS